MPPIIYKNQDYQFKIGKANVLKEGKDVAIIASGSILANAIKAADILLNKNITCTVIDMHTIKPLDTKVIDNLLTHKLIVTVEEHTILGGLGSAVAEYLASISYKPPHILLGIKDFFPHAGDYLYLLQQCGLSAEQIADEIEANLQI